MRITIPWGGIALIGGTIILTMTDWPSIIGWIAVIWGVVSLILQIVVVLFMSATLKVVKQMSPEDLKEQMTYQTNHGRRLPVKRQLTSVKNVKSAGDVVIDSKQS